MKVIIHPAANPLYAWFYIQALIQQFGKKNVSFSAKPFVDFPNDAHEVQLLFITIDESGKTTRYAIDTNDFHSVKSGVYDWCDVYGHCNANLKATPADQCDKLVSLCPGFGVRPESNPIWYALQAVSNAVQSHPTHLKRFMGKYLRSWTTCVPISEYKQIEAKDDYVFFCSTLWYNDEWNKNDETLNLTRARFIRACRRVGSLHFEGGLVSQGAERSSEQLFHDCLCRSYSKTDWLHKTQQSAIVFNTPAFWGCHGWKLGEYLALGKCIVSTPLLNDLPYPLEHGKNIHFVENNEDAMVQTIEYLLAHPDYRKELESGALEYWSNYGSMQASLSLLFNNNKNALYE